MIAWGVAESVVLRRCLGLELYDSTRDHTTISLRRGLVKGQQERLRCALSRLNVDAATVCPWVAVINDILPIRAFPDRNWRSEEPRVQLAADSEDGVANDFSVQAHGGFTPKELIRWIGSEFHRIFSRRPAGGG